MTATFLNRSTTKFSLNGLEYAKVFLPVKVSDTHLKIVNVYDTRFQLLEATKFDQLQVDGNTFASLAEALSSISGLVYSKVAVTGSAVAVSADAKNALVEGSDGGVYLDESLLSGGSSNPTELLSITTNWQSALTFKPYAEWKHNGTVKSFSGERTADPADATYDRFDLFIINLTTDTVEILKGTASANPEKPALTDPVNQLDTGIFISIKAGATTPDGVSGETVYAENATGEWSISGAGADFDVASPNSPHSGIVCIETLNPLQNGQSLIFSAPATIISEGKELSYKLKNKTGGDHSWLFVGTLAKNGRIGSVSVSAPNNYDPNLSTYQALSLPFPAELSEVSSVRIMAGFTGFEYHLDDVIIISGGGTVTSGVTKEYVDQGDADTLQAAKDYTDQVAGSGAGDSVKKRYLTWTALLADQAAQVDKGIYYAEDASGHSTVDAEGAYFEYLGTTAGTEADYRKLSEEESMDVVSADPTIVSADDKNAITAGTDGGAYLAKTETPADLYNVDEYTLNFDGTSGAISEGYIYAGAGEKLIKWTEEGSETLLTIPGTTDWRCVWESKAGAVFASPMDSVSATIATADHGLYKYDGAIVTKVIQLGDQESIWGIDEDSVGNIYAGVYSLGALNADIYKSTDGGASFTRVLDGASLLTGTQKHCHAVNVDLSNDAIYICLGDSATDNLNHKSTDGGATWSAIITENTTQQFTAVLAIEGARLFGSDRNGVGRIYRTTDDVNTNIVLDTHYQNVFFLRQSDLTGWIYCGFKLDPSATTNLRADLYISKDLGLTWTLYDTIENLSAGEGYWYGSEFYNGKMLVGTGKVGEWYNTLVINETTAPARTTAKQVGTSRKLTEFDNGKILEIINHVTLTVPENGLQDNFQIDVDAITGKPTFEGENANVILSCPSGNSLNLDAQAFLYRRKLSNIYRVKVFDPAATGTSPYPTENLFSYFAFEDNLADSKGLISATATGTATYATGITGTKAADFNDTWYITFADNDALSFTDGTNDKPFTISFMFKFDTPSASHEFLWKRNNDFAEWVVRFDGTRFVVHLYGDTTANRLELYVPFSGVAGQAYNIAVLYDGSKTAAGLKLAIDGTEKSETATMVGTYAGTQNTTAPVVMSQNPISGAVVLDGDMDGLAFWNKRLTSEELTNVSNKQHNGEELI